MDVPAEGGPAGQLQAGSATHCSSPAIEQRIALAFDISNNVLESGCPGR
jgi:hypothetical protein